MQLSQPWTRVHLEETLERLSNPAARADAMSDGSAPVLCLGILDGVRRYHLHRPWWFNEWCETVHAGGVDALNPREANERANTMTPEARRQLGMED